MAPVLTPHQGDEQVVAMTRLASASYSAEADASATT
jgi:hypothetical protein